MSIVYKIRNKNWSSPYNWSGGIVRKNAYSNPVTYSVKFGKKGKEWTDMKAVEKHLLTAITSGCFNPDWEIVTIEETKVTPVSELMTPKMTMGILKGKSK